jgi:hypothetical protein
MPCVFYKEAICVLIWWRVYPPFFPAFRRRLPLFKRTSLNRFIRSYTLKGEGMKKFPETSQNSSLSSGSLDVI